MFTSRIVRRLNLSDFPPPETKTAILSTFTPAHFYLDFSRYTGWCSAAALFLLSLVVNRFESVARLFFSYYSRQGKGSSSSTGLVCFGFSEKSNETARRVDKTAQPYARSFTASTMPRYCFSSGF